MKLWIQKSDFSTIEEESITEAEAYRLLREYDWESERQWEENAAAEGRENCPAGLGMIAGDDSVLHIVPAPEKESGAHVFFHTRERKRLLGLIPIDLPVSDDRMDVSDEDVHRLIALHFAGRTGEIFEFLTQ